MTKPVITKFSELVPLFVQSYQSYIPTAFDDSLSLLEKMNMIIQQMNKSGEITNGIVAQWNEVMEWVMNEGLNEGIDSKVDDMVLDGTFDTIINQKVFGVFNSKLDNYSNRLTTQESKKISQNDITEELRQQIVGTTSINAVPNDYSLTQRKFKNPLLVGLASKNLFNLNDIYVDFYIANNNGNQGALSGYIASEFIPIKPSTQYKLSGTTEQGAFYNASKQYISGYTDGGSLPLSPATASYIRITGRTTQISTIQLEEGSSQTPYESFTPKLDNNNIKPNTITSDKMAFTPLTAIMTKNLFNKATVTTGFFVANQNGSLTANATYDASEYITIKPNTQYKISGTTEQGAFYDLNKVYISGYTNGGALPLTPSNAVYMRMSVKDTQLSVVQLEEGSVATSYIPYGATLDPNLVKTPLPESAVALSDLIVRGKMSRNLFNLVKTTKDFYVSASNGLIGALSGYRASDYIEVKPNTPYTVTGTGEQGAFYDVNNVFISGFTFSNVTLNTPSNCKYIRLTCKEVQLPFVQLEEGSVATTYVKYGSVIGAEQLDVSIDSVVYVEVTVKPDGTGNYLSPKLANDAITDASKSKQYKVIIYPGTYTDVGWTLKPYIHLVGKHRKTCILKGELSSGATDSDVTNTSTIWLNSTNNLENLTITAKNMRYAVHDESSGSVKDFVRNIKNCHIEHFGNTIGTWTSQCAYGMGISSGANLYAENTTFKSPFAPFSVHNNVNFSKPAYVRLKGCRLEYVNTGLTPGSLRVQSLGSNTDDIMLLEGCYLNSPIVHNDNPWLGDVNAPTHIEWQVFGYGNSPTTMSSGFSNGETDTLKFTV